MYFFKIYRTTALLLNVRQQQGNMILKRQSFVFLAYFIISVDLNQGFVEKLRCESCVQRRFYHS
jgi:hypothetical protein